MEPILNKREIADLLTAIRDGRVSLEDSEEQEFLACSPLNLFQLARPDKEQFRIPNFDIILDIFCRLYATSLTNELQRTFSISRSNLQSHEFQQFMASNDNQGLIGILDLPPLKHGALIIFDLDLSFSMLEIMLGASSELESLQPERKLTTIELNILKTSITDACSDIDKAFAQLVELKSNLIKIDNNPRLVSIVDPEAEVIVGTLAVKVGDHSGQIHLVFPFATLEPLRELLREFLNISSQTKSSWQDIIEDKVSDIELSISAQSGELILRVEEVLNMKVGDLLALEYDPNSPLHILVEDSPKFLAIPGTVNGKKAVNITEILR